MSTVYTTAGGRRFHEDRLCWAFGNGAMTASYLAAEAWNYGGAGIPLYNTRETAPEDAARAGFTACRVCVPPALALPATGQTHGHERLTINPSCCGDDCCGGREEREVCVRCSNDVSRRHGWNWSLDVPWPCASAVVLGLVPRGAAL